jgi:hypothetical protein
MYFNKVHFHAFFDKFFLALHMIDHHDTYQFEDLKFLTQKYKKLSFHTNQHYLQKNIYE